jgi:hypothetical protein
VTGRRRRTAEVVVVIVSDPVAWREALLLAGGDARRCICNHDGSVTVVNQPCPGD